MPCQQLPSPTLPCAKAGVRWPSPPLLINTRGGTNNKGGGGKNFGEGEKQMTDSGGENFLRKEGSKQERSRNRRGERFWKQKRGVNIWKQRRKERFEKEQREEDIVDRGNTQGKRRIAAACLYSSPAPPTATPLVSNRQQRHPPSTSHHLPSLLQHCEKEEKTAALVATTTESRQQLLRHQQRHRQPLTIFLPLLQHPWRRRSRHLCTDGKNSSRHCPPPQRRITITTPTTAATIRNRRRKEKQQIEAGRRRNTEKTETEENRSEEKNAEKKRKADHHPSRSPVSNRQQQQHREPPPGLLSPPFPSSFFFFPMQVPLFMRTLGRINSGSAQISGPVPACPKKIQKNIFVKICDLFSKICLYCWCTWLFPPRNRYILRQELHQPHFRFKLLRKPVFGHLYIVWFQNPILQPTKLVSGLILFKKLYFVYMY